MTKKISALLIVLLVIVGVRSYAGPIYSDVDPGSWYHDAVMDVTVHQLMYGDGAEFRPDDTLTRAELAAVASRIAKQLDSVQSRKDDDTRRVEAIAKVMQSTVTLETPVNISTGFFVAPNQILTTNHQYARDEARQSTAVKFGSKEYAATIIKEDAIEDVTLLQIGEDVGFPLTFGDTVEMGQSIVTVGNPLNEGLSASAGIISAKGVVFAAGEQTYSVFDMVQMAIDHGNSGGALADLDGHVVGMVSAQSTTRAGIGYSVPVGAIRDFLGVQ